MQNKKQNKTQNKKLYSKIILVSCLLLSFIVSVSFLTIAVAEPEPEHEFIIGRSLPNDDWGYDPHSSFNTFFYDLGLETLFAYNITNPAGPIVGRLGVGYKWIDAMHLEVDLREGVTFHDETEFNAAVVKWNFERLYHIIHNLDPYLEYYYRLPADPFRGMEGVDLSWVSDGELVDILRECVIVNDYKVRFELNIPYTPFIHMLTGIGSYIISKEAHTEDKDRVMDFRNELIVGTGPFKDHVHIEVGSEDYVARSTFVANNDYWRKLPYITDLKINYYEGNERADDALIAGDVDYVIPRNDLINSLKINQYPSIELITGNSYTSWFLALNSEIPTEIKQSICYAIDYERVLQEVASGNAERSRGPIPKGVKNYNEELLTPTLDISRAREILILNGKASVDENWQATADSDFPIWELNYLYPSGSPARVAMFTVLYQNLREIGIKVVADIDDEFWWPRMFANDFGAMLTGWGADILDATNFIVPMFSSGSPYNVLNFEDTDVNTWMYEAVAAVDDSVIQNLYNDIQNRLQNVLCPAAFLFQPYSYFAINSEWTGVPKNIFYPSRSIYYIHEKSSDWTPELDPYAYIVLDVDIDEPIVIDPISDISLEFTNINIGGTSIVQISDETPEPITGFDVMGTYYDISTTVDFNGIVIVGMPYDDTPFEGVEIREFNEVFVMHYDENSLKWKEATRESIDTVNNIVYVRTSSFSIFAVMRLNYISATVDIDPDVYNLKSEREWITAYIEFPEELHFDISQINRDTIFLIGLLPVVPFPYEIGDYDHDGIPDLMVKFDIRPAKPLLVPTENFIVEITGQLYDGTEFKGYDTVRIE